MRNSEGSSAGIARIFCATGLYFFFVFTKTSTGVAVGTTESGVDAWLGAEDETEGGWSGGGNNGEDEIEDGTKLWTEDGTDAGTESGTRDDAIDGLGFLDTGTEDRRERREGGKCSLSQAYR